MGYNALQSMADVGFVRSGARATCISHAIRKFVFLLSVEEKISNWFCHSQASFLGPPVVVMNEDFKSVKCLTSLGLRLCLIIRSYL